MRACSWTGTLLHAGRARARVTWAAALLAVVLGLTVASPASAAIACSATSSGVSVGFFDTGRTTPTQLTGSVSVNCTRSSLTQDPAIVYVALGVNLGLQPSGNLSRAVRVGGSNTLDYTLYRDAANTLFWTDKGGGNFEKLTATLNFGTGATASQSLTFYATVPQTSAQSQPLVAGVYQDTQTMNLYLSTVSTTDAGKSSQVVSTSTFPVQVTVPQNCVLSSAPGNLAFAYTSFQTNAVTASTSFAVTCMSNVAYTMSLDATTGTLTGLTYTLALSATSRVGTGVPQSTTITGTIAAGQSGICSTPSCTASAVRTLTITY